MKKIYQVEVYVQQQTTVTNGILNIERKMGPWDIPDNKEASYDEAMAYAKDILDGKLVIKDNITNRYVIYPKRSILRVELIEITVV